MILTLLTYLSHLIDTVIFYDPKCFISITDIKSCQEDYDDTPR